VPATQRFLAPLLLLILALPLAMMAMAAGLGLQPSSLWSWPGLSLLFLVIPGLVLAIRGLSLGPKPGQPFDARRFERQGRSILLAVAFVIGPVALLAAAITSPTVAVLIIAVVAVWVLIWTPSWLRRVNIETTVLIQRDPAAVFSFVADSRNQPLYASTVQSVEKITDGPVGPGTQFRTKVQVTPATTWEAIGGIVDFEPNRRLTFRVVSVRDPNLDVFTFTPADGGTVLKHRFESEISFNLALIAAAFRIPQARRQMAASSQTGWIKLKQILESEPPKT
jgi:uncharacterized protein YndB with AHSA1/START domain